MPHKALFFLQALIIAVVGAIHVSATKYFLYWHYVWLDVPVHFLGGLWLGLLSAWLLSSRQLPVSYVRVMLTVLIVSIGWEVFEIAAGVPIEKNFVFDTSLDLVMDILGGTLGYVIARKLLT